MFFKLRIRGAVLPRDRNQLLHLRTALYRDLERPQPSAEFVSALRGQQAEKASEV
jgi:hypothetical protein